VKLRISAFDHPLTAAVEGGYALDASVRDPPSWCFIISAELARTRYWVGWGCLGKSRNVACGVEGRYTG
jgi:hypothetical protein